jgi:hypothetical protein
MAVGRRRGARRLLTEDCATPPGSRVAERDLAAPQRNGRL